MHSGSRLDAGRDSETGELARTRGNLSLSRLVAALVGFFVAPIVPVVALGTWVVIKTGSMHATLLPEMLMTYPLSVMATGGFGVPAFLVFLRYGLIRWWSTVVVGALGGAVVAILFDLSLVDGTNEILFFSLTGAASAFAFWLIWSQGRDKPKNS